MQDPLLSRFLSFLDASPTPYHAVEQARMALEAAGFREFLETAPPETLQPGQKGYIRRSGSIMAFRLGTEPLEVAGFHLVSAHTDSPNLRIKPQPLLKSHGYVRLGVEVYGGVLQATWTDRDLGLAGQVFLRSSQGQARRLVDIRRPICRIPNVAIHLNRTVNDEGLKLNPQTQLPALLGLDQEGEDPLRALLSQQLGCEARDILSWDLCLFDLLAPTLGGQNQEFVFSGRLDNLGSSHAALEAMLQSDGQHKATSVIALFDHEEVGSTTSRGAAGRWLGQNLERLCRDSALDQALSRRGGLGRAIASSWHLSSDMAHAVHPAWADKHDAQHMPFLGKGPVIKQNSSQRYGTEAETAAMLIPLFEETEVPFQWFVNRADLACGSTVGPLVAAELGLRTVDVGNPMLSMHSIREMAGSKDHQQMVKVMAKFLTF